MFAKLLKHEFKTIGKNLGFLCIAAILSGALGGFMMHLGLKSSDNVSMRAIESLAALLLIGIYIGLIVFAFGSFIYLYYNFYRNKFSDEGYLTFTLPASTHQILLSSIVNILIWQVIISLVLIVSIVLIVLPTVLWLSENLPTNSITPSIPGVTIEYSVWEIIVTLLGQFAYSVILPLFSITVGSIIVKKRKLLTAFGIGYGISMVINMLSGFLEIYFMEFNDYSVQYIGAGSAITSVLMLVLSVAGYFLMHHFIQNKLNL